MTPAVGNWTTEEKLAKMCERGWVEVKRTDRFEDARVLVELHHPGDHVVTFRSLPQPLDDWHMATTNYRADANGRCLACARPWGGHAATKCYPQSAGDLGSVKDGLEDASPRWDLLVEVEQPQMQLALDA